MPQIDAQLFQCFSDSVPYGVCFIDLQGKIIYWNAAAERLTGYMAPEVLGRAYRGDLLVHCKDNTICTEEQCPVLEALHDGNAVAANLFLRHKDGHRLPIRVSAFPLRNASGEVSGVSEIFDTYSRKNDGSPWEGHSDREFEMAEFEKVRSSELGNALPNPNGKGLACRVGASGWKTSQPRLD
jgi:PAS domain S-box-containing protein